MSALTPSLPALAGSAPGALGTLASAPGESTLAGIAEQLGMSAESLQHALREGQSIANLAEQQGVPRESIGSFIAAQIQRARQYSGQPPLDQGALDRMVDRALDRGRRADSTEASRAASPESVALATYANNARVAPVAVPPGTNISLLV